MAGFGANPAGCFPGPETPTSSPEPEATLIPPSGLFHLTFPGQSATSYGSFAGPYLCSSLRQMGHCTVHNEEKAVG